MPKDNKNNFAQLAALFLSEELRSRRTSLKRAAEIASLVVKRIPEINSETEALAFLTGIEKDFEEVTVLKQALSFGYKESDIKVYEKEIKEFAASIFPQDMVTSTEFLRDAATAGMTIQELALKYPEFCQYLIMTDKGQLLAPVMR